MSNFAVIGRWLQAQDGGQFKQKKRAAGGAESSPSWAHPRWSLSHRSASGTLVNYEQTVRGRVHRYNMSKQSGPTVVGAPEVVLEPQVGLLAAGPGKY